MKVTVFLMGHFLTCAHFTFAVEPPVMLNYVIVNWVFMDAVHLQLFLEVSKNMAYIWLNSMIIIHFSSISLVIVQKIIMHISLGSTRLIKWLCPEILNRWKSFVGNLSLFHNVSNKNDYVTVNIKLF